jgi:hypothetical protein
VLASRAFAIFFRRTMAHEGNMAKPLHFCIQLQWQTRLMFVQTKLFERNSILLDGSFGSRCRGESLMQRIKVSESSGEIIKTLAKHWSLMNSDQRVTKAKTSNSTSSPSLSAHKIRLSFDKHQTTARAFHAVYLWCALLCDHNVNVFTLIGA